MLKTLITAGVVVIGMALFVARQDERATQEAAQKAAQLHKATIPTQTCEQHPQEDIYDPARNTPSWYGFFRWPNGTTTWAIILTLIAIAWQSNETHNAAEAARDSIRIQEAGLKQWIDIQLTTTKGRNPIVVEGDSLPRTIEIWFRVANQTAYPVTIQEICVAISRKRPDGDKWEEYTASDIISLIPRAKIEQTVTGLPNFSDYHFFVCLSMDIPMAAQYRADIFKFSVNGHISFMPNVGPKETQRFGYLAMCGQDKVHIFPVGTELTKGKEVEMKD